MKFEVVKKLRLKTSYPIMECKKALEEVGGDYNKAEEILKKRGIEKISEKNERKTSAGIIESYSHQGKVGVLVEVLCETDFVAKNKEFSSLVHNLTLQIASMNPKDIKELLNQPFIKEENRIISDLLDEKIRKTGENIKLKRFIRWELGE